MGETYEKAELEAQHAAFLSMHAALQPMSREFQIRTVAAIAVLFGIDADLIARLKAAKP